MHIFKNVDGVGPLNGHLRLTGHLDGLVVLREDAQCMTGGAPKWASVITEGSLDIDEIKNTRCK
jgi:hypothetical protein